MEDKIKAVMAEILEIDEGEISADFGPDDVDNWDSLNNLRMITALEAEFDVQFSMADIQEMQTFQNIHEVIGRYVS